MKWKEKENISGSKLKRIEEKISKFKCKKFIITPSEDSLSKTPDFAQILTPNELVSLSKESLESLSHIHSG